MKTYSEIPIDDIFYDPSLPQKTYTAKEWYELFGENFSNSVKPDTQEYDERIAKMYEDDCPIFEIAKELKLMFDFVSGRLIFMGYDTSLKVRGGRKSG